MSIHQHTHGDVGGSATRAAPRVRACTAAALLALMLATGCRSRPPLVEAPPALDVENASHDDVIIMARGCEATEQPTQLHPDVLRSGASLHVPMGAGCYDFDALRPDGEVVGRQHGVSLRRPMEWRIR